ncbi:hypothetical protein V7S43_018308 [Phytophthora oleae]|uniref:Uncharacterized protein n=1 Tax=Phytophthora oleae TaxID=2107226 RepID=A0ABD3EUQ3_9STRA
MMSLIPAFTMAILVECIPLKPPDEGWKANYAFWIRLYVSSLPIAFGAVFQVKDVIEPDVISSSGVFITGVGSCTCYVALTILIAEKWKFPIPFGYVLTVAPFVFFYMVFFLLSIGPKKLKSQALRHQLFSQMTVIAAQGVLAIAYPTFSAVFNQLSGPQQSVFIFVLPLIKFSVKQVVAKASAHLRECVGLIVVFSVDMCNVLYVVVCMQTAISPLTTTLMITFDAFFVLLALRSIYYQADASQGRRSVNSSKENYIEDLLVGIQKIFRASESPVPIRVHSPVPLPLSIESTRYMNDLVNGKRRNARDVDSTKALSMGSTKVLPITQVAVTPLQMTGKLAVGPKLPLTLSSCKSVAPVRHDTEIQDAQGALQMLFHSEYVIVAEYIESAIPVLYAVYLALLYHLPTAAYYPHTRSLTPQNFVRALINLFLYSLVEFASFSGLAVMLKRKCGFSPVYQLAFVLETQVTTIQGHLFLWISVILQMTLVHNGVDLEVPFK